MPIQKHEIYINQTNNMKKHKKQRPKITLNVDMTSTDLSTHENSKIIDLAMKLKNDLHCGIQINYAS